ncbi:MAG: phage terminase large subunit [Alphaproteobacteria bacterium]|nr:phage terminase large subunit [Alphaproteobacteria bacterium]
MAKANRGRFIKLLEAEIHRLETEEAERLSADDKRSFEELLEQSRKKCETLAGFIREAWHVVEPDAKYVHNWHIDVVCEHLEAVSVGKITRLLINVPPGSMKSLIVSVFWPAWEWARGNTSLRYLTTAFNDGPVKRDTRKMRDLLLSEWYKARFPHVRLVRAGETSFANDNTGSREGVAFGSLTSQRGDRLIIDDPHSTESAESDAERLTTTRRFREGASNRLNDQKRSAIVIIMQRIHGEDLSGVILRLGLPYVHLCLPMEFEPERCCYTSLKPNRGGSPIRAVYDAEKQTWYRVGAKVPEDRRAILADCPMQEVYRQDPRTKANELLDIVRFPAEVLGELRTTLGSYAYAGQYQQRPAPREGGMFKREWFLQVVGTVPVGARRVRRWDFAATVEAPGSDPDWTVGLLMAQLDDTYYVEDVIRFRGTPKAVRKAVRDAAKSDGYGVEIEIPEDPGQAGKAQSSSIIAENAGYKIQAVRETGSKATRAEPFSAQAEAGNVVLVRASWNQPYIDELCSFPVGHDDQVDTSSGAFNKLAGRRTFTVTDDVLKRAKREVRR